MNKHVADDGFHSESVKFAEFDTMFEIPVIEPNKKIVIPDSLVPYSKIKYADKKKTAICFYEHDRVFKNAADDPESVCGRISGFQAVLTPDCSLYWDMPLCLQLFNIYRNRRAGCCWQSKGMYVIPNIRWGDERTYATGVLNAKIAFAGAPKRSIVSIGTYGCMRTREHKYHFKAGLEAMLLELEPKVVLVYGRMPGKIFDDYAECAKFVRYDDWTTLKRREKNPDFEIDTKENPGNGTKSVK